MPAPLAEDGDSGAEEDGPKPVLSPSGIVTLRGTKIGRLSYMLQWEPISTSCNCSLHPGCSVTGDIRLVNVDELLGWLVAAPLYSDASAHCDIKVRPANTYNKRLQAAAAKLAKSKAPAP